MFTISELPMLNVRHWRRQRILQRTHFDEQLWRHTLEDLPLLQGLSCDECARLRELVILFRHEKRFIGGAELELDEPMELLISTQACLLVLNLGLDWYHDHWHSIIVYPDRFMARQERIDAAGVVHQTRDARAGEAWQNGPVVLSWRDVLETGGGYNVVIHEFAHKLDLLNGDCNGFPPLHADMDGTIWYRVFSHAYKDFCQLTATQHRSIFDDYAATSPGEFFAVMSEAFFETPHHLRRHYPNVYNQLRAFYRQDPATRLMLRTDLAC